MLGVLLAALSGVSYGASDFSGALASKKNNAALVTVLMQAVSLGALIVLLVIWPADQRTLADLSWGALGGLGAALGLTTFYMALARGPMSTAASITGLVGALVPVVAGLALGDRPAAITLVGVAVSVPAVVMLSSAPGVRLAPTTPPRERVALQHRTNQTRLLAFVAGLGFGLFFVALSRTSADSGLFPLVGARAASIVALALVLTTRRNWGRVTKASWPLVIGAGVLDCAANSFYLTALDHGTFIWVAAITSLYPASTVILARIVLKERLGGIQLAGLFLAVAALVLIAVGR